MRILWLTNREIPEISNHIGNKAVVNEGWLSFTFNQINSSPEHEMSIICCGSNTNDKGVFKNVQWFTIKESHFDESHYSGHLEERFCTILNDISPDVIHIWGSEFPHTLCMVNAAIRTKMIGKVVLSIQGIISMCSLRHYFFAGIPYDVVNKPTIYDRIRNTGLLKQWLNFSIRSEFEIMAIKKIQNVIGRTEWDKRVIYSINPDLDYYCCNETLRKEFYFGEWSYSKCVPHTIFISQGGSALKGLHNFLQILPDLKKKYPDIHVYVAGHDPTMRNRLIDRLKQTSYSKYICRLIKRYSIDSLITFTGSLSAEEMKTLYLQSNVFLCCSSIENSSNSVGEAMILGTPVVTSDVGGMRSIISKDECLYFDTLNCVDMLNSIESVFNMKEQIENISKKARLHAIKDHDPQINYRTLVNVYKEIYERSKED